MRNLTIITLIALAFIGVHIFDWVRGVGGAAGEHRLAIALVVIAYLVYLGHGLYVRTKAR